MIETLVFGRTGHASTRLIFGAAALSGATPAQADEALDLVLEYGINHIDTAASYGDSELRLGPWMERQRQRFFLATKTGERRYQAAKDEFHRSLERLRVSSVDLLQLHYLVDAQEWEVAMGPGGVLEMAIEARQQGLVRFIGVTGHEVTVAAMHKKSLERFDFDAILLPYNYIMMQNAQYAADFEAVVALCQSRRVAIQTIKGITRGPWNSARHTHSTWYAPLSEQADIDLAAHWVLGRTGIFLNTAADIGLLRQTLEAATRFQTRPSDEQMQALVAKTAMTPLFT